MLFGAFPPAAFPIIQFTILLSVYQSYSISRCTNSLDYSWHQLFKYPFYISSHSQTSTGLSWNTSFSRLCTISFVTPFFSTT